MSSATLVIWYASHEAFLQGKIEGAPPEIRVETYRRGLQGCRDLTPEEFALLEQFEESTLDVDGWGPINFEDEDNTPPGFESFSNICLDEDAMRDAPANPLIEEILKMEEGFDLLNVDFTAIIGMDRIGRVAWTFNRKTRTAVATTGVPDEDRVSWVPLDALNGPPICKLDDGSKAIVDTGAYYSYGIGPVPRTARVVGEFEDWSILWGAVHSPLWEDTLQIGGQSFLVRFGKLPSKAESTLAWMGTGWIIGADLLRQFLVTMDFPRGRMGLQALASIQTPQGGSIRG